MVEADPVTGETDLIESSEDEPEDGGLVKGRTLVSLEGFLGGESEREEGRVPRSTSVPPFLFTRVWKVKVRNGWRPTEDTRDR